MKAQLAMSTLPPVRGRYTENAALGEAGWFKCGGKAEILFKPADLADLQDFLKNCPADIPVHVFGALSNTIVRDGGLPGVTIRLGREFSGIEAMGETVKAGALALDANVAQVAAESGIGGLEFLSGIPGTIGGALRMNAGCYGTEMKDILLSCEAVDRTGKLHTFTPDQMDMTYRHTGVPDGYIFVSATMKGREDMADLVLGRMAEIKMKREESQPIREKTGGSTFANPPGDQKVWQLIDAVGGRGLQIGGALMSEKHCNFMINDGSATSADLENLGEELIKRVREKFGIALRWEIKRVGVA
ncbi:MAG: UDP-N-acetylenolpyruvoylglucosamine reductase [Micavibrio aeruginosavorus]|uniref:UDP-N-acetylenolpyruvoylglucosamine reductase n=1 Tax=Micavibrio aeruginosavorus TaxID=349221 RepID=A0A2W5MTB4_9BACT|nr:MAG: UDP-N-acetylenolpyruvoylglucosamine reductase [Micavibrio aeruginosavorus]